MSNEFLTRDEAGSPMLLQVIGLYGQRERVRIGLRVQVNNLTRSVAERKKLYADLRRQEDELTEQIQQILPHLEAEDRRQLLEKYEPAQVPA